MAKEENEMDYVKATINNEGFDYAFIHYSNYTEIKDEKFHELRKSFLDARQALEDYVNANSKI